MAAVFVTALCVVFTVAGCQKLRPTDTQPLYKSGMWSDTIRQLRDMNVTDSEIADLIKIHEAGFSDNGCVELMKLIRSRKQEFTSGEAVVGLLHAGIAEPVVMELANLDQIGPWALEAQGIRLGGFSDQVVLAVAHRRAERMPTVSAASLLELKNTAETEDQILKQVSGGLTDEQAGQIIAAHKQMQAPTPFIRRTRSSRRHH